MGGWELFLFLYRHHIAALIYAALGADLMRQLALVAARAFRE
jgi:hypothetical protein